MSKAVNYIPHFFSLIIISSAALADTPPLVLPSNQWQQISLPAHLTVNNTVADIFANDIPGVYGTDWVLFGYDAANNNYQKPTLTDPVIQGKGYWIIQLSAETIQVSFPPSASTTILSQTTQCPSASGCFTIPLPTLAEKIQWSMLGNPFSIPFIWNRSRVVTDSGTCSDSDGCTLDEAREQNIFQHQAWHYQKPSYEIIEGNIPLQAWDGFWVATLAGANSLNPRLLLPYDNSLTGNISQADAARFLTQSTFGPTLESIDGLVARGSYESWIDDQFELPDSGKQLAGLEAMWLQTCPSNGQGGLRNSRSEVIDIDIDGSIRSSIWWNSVLNGPDQLRQRVAFALSEILVVSSVGPLFNRAFGMADYYDVLSQHALGNYRNLLEDVTLHPMMGRYLSMLRNEKANPELNIRPDENYAREVLQLFSIGVHKLNIDGSIRNTAGILDPAYDQRVIEGFAKVFTGWNFANATSWDIYIDDGDTTRPMIPWPDYHDSVSEKRLLNGIFLPAGQSAEKDLQDALDNIFAHGNVGPFISKQLIQRLVTSNPSPTYIQRVAEKFNDNGEGVRGDLKAVVKAILLDDEARIGHLTTPHFGKLREPLLRLSHLRRAFGVQPVAHQGPRWGGDTCGRGVYYLYSMPVDNARRWFGQDIMQSPSVFNFFLPSYSPPGVVHNAGLVAPEFQIATENTLVHLANEIGSEIQNSDTVSDWTNIKTNRETALANNLNFLLDHLNLLLLNGDMSMSLRQLLLAHLQSDTFPDSETGRKAQARDAIMLIVTSPDYLIQK